MNRLLQLLLVVNDFFQVLSMPKATNGYYLEVSNIKWLEQRAKKEDRSASYYLDRLLSLLREADNQEVKQPKQE
jgi:hypothetical protein